MKVRNNKIASVVSTFSDAELALAYVDINHFKETGDIKYNGWFSKIEKEVRLKNHMSTECYHYAESEILLEIARRFYNSIQDKLFPNISSGTPLWFINKENGKIEKARVFSVCCKENGSSTFFVDFESGKFAEYPIEALGTLCFKNEDEAKDNLD